MTENLKPKNTGFLDVDSFDQKQFELLASKLIKEFKVKVWLCLPNDKKGSLDLIINEIRSPIKESFEFVSSKEVDLLKKNDDGQKILASTRSLALLIDKLKGQTWYLFGMIEKTGKKSA